MIDISGLSYFMPIFGFLLVFVIVYALLVKINFLEGDTFVKLLISFILAIIFATLAPAQQYLQTVTPWAIALIFSLFFILLLIGMGQREIDKIIRPGVLWVFIAILIIIFVVSLIKIFPHAAGGAWNTVSNFVTTESRIVGGIILLAIGALTAWVISKGGE